MLGNQHADDSTGAGLNRGRAECRRGEQQRHDVCDRFTLRNQRGDFVADRRRHAGRAVGIQTGKHRDRLVGRQRVGLHRGMDISDGGCDVEPILGNEKPKRGASLYLLDRLSLMRHRDKRRDGLVERDAAGNQRGEFATGRGMKAVRHVERQARKQDDGLGRV